RRRRRARERRAGGAARAPAAPRRRGERRRRGAARGGWDLRVLATLRRDALGDELGDLDRVQRRALEQVVADDEEVERARVVEVLHLLVGVPLVVQGAEERHDVEGERVGVDVVLDLAGGARAVVHQLVDVLADGRDLPGELVDALLARATRRLEARADHRLQA